MTTVSTCARKCKELFWEHFNCIPWFVCGMFNLLGEVSKFEYALCWICVLILIWMYVPADPVKAMHRRSSDGKNNIEKGSGKAWHVGTSYWRKVGAIRSGLMGAT